MSTVQAILFKNFSDKEFTWSYDGVPYTFGVGQEMYMEDYKAHHFAKHLIDRELTKKDIVTTNKFEIEKLLPLALPKEKAIEPAQILDANIRKEKKVKVKKAESEKEFEGLNEK